MARFTLDAHQAPVRRDLYLTRSDYGEFREPVEGLEAGDVVEQAAFTAKANPADGDAAATTIQRVTDGDIANADHGDIELVNGVPVVSFLFPREQAAKLLQSRPYEIRLWILRGGLLRWRAWMVGTMHPYANITAETAVL